MSISEANGKTLVKCHAGCSQEAVISELQHRGLWSTHDPAEIPLKHLTLGEYHQHWDYHDAAGQHVQRICRWDQPGGRKDIRQLSWQDNRWQWKALPEPRPLYHLPKLKQSSARVLVVEGEKSADAAGKLFPHEFAVTCWAGGAKAAAKTDWQPLAGRDVTLWPDADDVGKDAMRGIASALAKLNCTVRIADLAPLGSLPSGWDAADALTDTAFDQHDALWTALANATPLVQSKQVSKLLWAADLKHLESKPHLISRLIELGGLAEVFGESNTGKSTVALDMALAIVRGIPWCGRMTQQGPVLWIAGEGVNGMRQRLMAYCRHKGIEPNFPFALLPSAPCVLTEDGIRDLLKAANEIRERTQQWPALIVLDTLARAMAGGDENEGRDMGRAVAACDRLRAETGATVLVVHHSGKDPTKGARGHSSLRAAVDTEIFVSGQSGVRSATVTKQRDMASGDEFAFELEPVVIGRDTIQAMDVTACVVVHKGAETLPRKKPTGAQQVKLLELLESRHALGDVAWTDADIRKLARDSLGMQKSSARAAVMGLTQSGYLQPSVGGLTLVNPPHLPTGAKGTNGDKSPVSSQDLRDKRDKGSIDPVLLSRPLSPGSSPTQAPDGNP